MVALAHPQHSPAEDATSSFPGSPSVNGTYLDEVLMMRNAAGTKYYYHANHLYSVHAITNSAGAIVEAVQSYDAYGKPTILTGAGTDATWFTTDDVTASVSAIGNPWFYTGQRLDAETGLMYFKNRYFDTGLGRFVGRDPIKYEGGANLFEYVTSKPVRLIDRYGFEGKPGEDYECGEEEAPPYKEKVCCCCAEDIEIASKRQNVWDTGGIAGYMFGHIFDVKFKYSYKLNEKVKGDCTLAWEEWYTSVPASYGGRVKPKEWQDMTQKYPESPMWKGWANRPKECPGDNQSVMLNDLPQAGSLIAAPRGLWFKITITSTPGCPCEKESVTIYAAQSLGPRKAGDKLDHEPWHLEPGTKAPGVQGPYD